MTTNTITLTEEQDELWTRVYADTYNSMLPPKNNDSVVAAADRALLRKWPELAQYEHWKHPEPPY